MTDYYLPGGIYSQCSILHPCGSTYRNLLVFSAVSSSSTKSCNLPLDNDLHHLIIERCKYQCNDALLMKIMSSIKKNIYKSDSLNEV